MELLIISFFAGILTVASPCVFTLLPIIVGGSAGEKKWTRVAIITLSLAVSVIAFTMILKYSTSLIGIDPIIWKIISGGIVLFLGLTMLFSVYWDKISTRFKLNTNSQVFLNYSSQIEGKPGNILTGLALGPVFSSCSPTYSLILATVLPVNLTQGLVYVIVYSLGLAFIMFSIGIFGQTLIKRLKWAVDPHGPFRIILGLIFIIVGIFIITGLDKKIETYLTESGSFDFALNFEQELLK